MDVAPVVGGVDLRPPPADLVDALNRGAGPAVDRMLSAFVSDIAFYRRLPEEQLRSDIAAVCRENLRAFVQCCRQDRLPSSGELAAARAGAVRRAEEGVPLDALLMAYTTGNRITWQLLAEQVPPGREAEIRAFTPYVQRYLQSMLQAVTEAYVEERRSIEHDEGSASRALVQQLVEGADATALALRLGVVLAEAYLVVAVRLGSHADEQAAGVDPDVAARRKMRRVQAAVDRLPGRAASLALLDPAGGVVLLPGIGPRLPGRAETSRTIRSLADSGGVECTAVAVPAPAPADLPAAAEQARALLALACALDRDPGTYTVDDLVLEHQLALPGPARRHLAGLLRPLLGHPDLLPTARCWLRNERARRETSDELHVHPNTLDKRLERITQLTGIEVGTTRGVAMLQAGLVALELEPATRGPQEQHPTKTCRQGLP